jgi:hypothetical protein
MNVIDMLICPGEQKVTTAFCVQDDMGMDRLFGFGGIS